MPHFSHGSNRFGADADLTIDHAFRSVRLGIPRECADSIGATFDDCQEKEMFDKLKNAASDMINSNTDTAKATANEATSGSGLDGLLGQFGGMSGIMDAVKDIRFPVNVDDLVPKLERAGVPSGVVDKIKDSGIQQIDSADDLVALAKKFLG